MKHTIQYFQSELVTIPEYVTKASFRLCAGGGAGRGGVDGDAGEYYSTRYFDVEPGEKLSLVVGKGGNQGDGGDTVVHYSGTENTEEFNLSVCGGECPDNDGPWGENGGDGSVEITYK